jgi:hypothetical protein
MMFLLFIYTIPLMSANLRVCSLPIAFRVYAFDGQFIHYLLGKKVLLWLAFGEISPTVGTQTFLLSCNPKLNAYPAKCMTT